MTTVRYHTLRLPHGMIAALLASLLTVLAAPSMATAHAYLVRADPAQSSLLSNAPHAVHLWFSEQIELPPAALEFFGPDGRPLPIENIAIAPHDATEVQGTISPRGHGTYTVRWRVISADTHPVWGSFTFSIGYATAPVTLQTAPSGALTALALFLQTLSRWLTYVGIAALISLMLGRLLSLTDAAAATLMSGDRRARRLFMVGAVLVVLALPLTVIAQMTGLADDSAQLLNADLLGAALSGRLGPLLVVRFLLLVVLFAMASRWPRNVENSEPVASHSRAFITTPATWLSLVLSLGLLLTLSLSSHATLSDPVPLSLAIDLVHLSAMTLWIGGLLLLVFVVLPTVRSLEATQRGAVLASVLRRFAPLAAISMLLLALSGLYSALHLLSSPLDLLTSEYGRALTLKMLIVAAIMLLAGFSTLTVYPALQRSSRRTNGIWLATRTLLRLESGLALVLLVAVGLLSSLPPARQPADSAAFPTDNQPALMIGRTAGTDFVMLRLADPAGTQFECALTDLKGAPLSGKKVVLTATEALRGRSQVTLQEREPGTYSGGELGAGVWDLIVSISGSTQAREQAEFSLTLPLRPVGGLLRAEAHASSQLRTAAEDVLFSGAGKTVPAHRLFIAPDRGYQSELSSEGVIEQYWQGGEVWRRIGSGQWMHDALPAGSPYAWPSDTYRFDLTANSPYISGSGVIDGQRCDIVSWWHPYNNASETWWIGQQDHLPHAEIIAQAGSVTSGHLHSFNQPVHLPEQLPPSTGS